MRIFNRFCRYIIPFWKIEALALLLGSLSMALGLVGPYLAKLVIDKAYPAKDLKLFIILIIAIGIIFTLTNLFKGLGNYLNRYVKLRVNLGLNRAIIKKLHQFSYSFFQDRSTGEHLYKISYDIDQASQLTADLLPQLILLIPKSLFIVGIILYINPGMFIFILALTPFLYISPYYFSKRLRSAWRIWVEKSEVIFKRLQEVLSHIQLVKGFGKEKHEERAYIKSLIDNVRTRLKNTRLEVTGTFVNNLAQRAILGLIIIYGGYQVIKGRMTLGSLGAISIYLGQLSGVQSTLANFIQQIPSGLVSCDRLEKILANQLVTDEKLSIREIRFNNGRIEFKNITFGYNQDKKVLEDLSFNIEGGSCIALTGPSGCGKTTIVNLILRLYKPLSGGIFIDGVDINNIKSNSLYEQIGMVLQESYLWNDTIENNIRYGRMGAAFEDIKEVGRITCIDSFVNSLSSRYKTIIGENACKISEGQKQRIAIARALIKKPKILILDEALSSVDMELENRVIDNMRSFLKNSTFIIISHRISTIRRAELVYFMPGSGRIVTGTHEKFLEVNLQYQNYLANTLK